MCKPPIPMSVLTIPLLQIWSHSRAGVGDGERGLKLADEDLTAEPEVRRTWNALQEEAHDCRRSLVRSHTVQIDGVDVGAFVVASPEGARGLTLGGIGVVEVFEQGRPEVGRADVPCWFLNAAFEY